METAHVLPEERCKTCGCAHSTGCKSCGCLCPKVDGHCKCYGS